MKIKITGTEEILEVGDSIGHVKNNWRKRHVSIFAHPTDAMKVITVGKGFNDGSDANCVENLDDWKNEIGKFNTVYN